MARRDDSLLWLGLAGIAAYVVYATQSDSDAPAVPNEELATVPETPASIDTSSQGSASSQESAMGSLFSSVRGIRNKNPGNIRRSSIAWQGLAPTQTDKEFFQFSSMAYGVRAIAKILTTYQGRGSRSITQMISTWAPPKENNTAAYIAAVSTDLGVDPDDPLDLTDFETMAAMTRAIIKHENGRIASALVSDSTLRDGVALAFNS